MTAIIKCADMGCPSRSHCWRFMMPAGPEQSFADYGAERGYDDKRCRHYVNGDLMRKRWRDSQDAGQSRTGNS